MSDTSMWGLEKYLMPKPGNKESVELDVEAVLNVYYNISNTKLITKY